VLTFQEADLDAITLDSGITLPLVRMTTGGLPEIEIALGEQSYTYDRSYNIKGSSAIMPKYVAELLSAGKKPLVIERPTRYYLYVAS
jgi:hypothetical protein